MGSRRILVVEGTSSVHEELLRTRMSEHQEWEVVSVGSRQEALDFLGSQPADVVIVDLHLSDAGGPRLLKEVQNHHPETVRLALSDSSDKDLILQCAGAAHRYLATPCEPGFLWHVLESTHSLGDRLANEKVKRLVSRVDRLPPVPVLYKKICDLLESESATTEQIGRIISRDPGMSANLLKLVNSAYFSLRRQVSDTTEAVAYLGIDALKAVVLATGIFDHVGKFESSSFNIVHLWSHTLSVAFAAKEIAHQEKAGNSLEVECFTAGLLHDTGILLLASQFPKEYQRIEALVQRDGMLLQAADMKVFGVTHGDVGAYLMGLWGLPESIVNAVSWHHVPSFETAKGFTPTVAVHAADVLAGVSHHPIFANHQLDELYLQSLGLKQRVEAWREQVVA